MKQFAVFFTITLKHTFYVGNIGKDLELEPSPQTALLMRHYDLKWHQNGSVYTLYFGKESTRPAALSLLDGPIMLQFILRSNTPWFYNITEIPFPKNTTQRLQFYNFREAVAPDEQGMISLAQAAVVSDDDYIDKDIGLKPEDLGVVDIHIGRNCKFMLVPPPQVVVSTPPEVTQYQLMFQARETNWRYYIMSRDKPELDFKVALNLDKITITDSKSLIEEVLLTTEDTARPIKGSSQMAVPISIQTPFPLSEQPQRKLKIKLFRKNGSGTANTPFMDIDLPTPDWKRVTQTAVDQPVFSDMYIYL
jgi:hypothetical protein